KRAQVVQTSKVVCPRKSLHRAAIPGQPGGDGADSKEKYNLHVIAFDVIQCTQVLIRQVVRNYCRQCTRQPAPIIKDESGQNDWQVIQMLNGSRTGVVVEPCDDQQQSDNYRRSNGSRQRRRTSLRVSVGSATH